MCRTIPRADFEEDFVDGLSLGNGTVDHFVVNVIVDHDVLRGAVFFVRPGYIERCPPSEEAEDGSGDFQHVLTHAIHPIAGLTPLGPVVKAERLGTTSCSARPFVWSE